MPAGPATSMNAAISSSRAAAGAFHWLETPLGAGATLIEASAGTGKTFTLAAIYVRLIMEAPDDAPLDVRQILVATFSRAATAELRERLRRALHEAYLTLRHARVHGALPDAADQLAAHYYHLTPERLPRLVDRLEDALRDFDDAAIFTLHSFFQRVLKQNPFESGLLFSTELETDADPLFQELAEDFWRRHCHEAPPLFLAALDKAKTTPDRLARTARMLNSRGHLEIDPPYQPGNLRLLEDRAREIAVSALAALDDEAPIFLKGLGPGGARIGAFNKPYKDLPAQHPRLLEDLRTLLTGGFPYPSDSLDLLEHFGEEALQGGVTKRSAEAETRAWLKRFRLLPLLDDLRKLARLWVEAFYLEFVHLATGELEAKNRERDIHTFNSLETRLGEILADPERGPALCRRLREDYAVCLLDEFQDTNQVQSDIFFTLFAGRPLFLIGDPKQAIYEFRGADLNAYIAAAERVEAIYTLPYNYRSSPRLVQAAQAVFNARQPPFAIPGIEHPRVEASPSGNKAVQADWTWPADAPPEDEAPLQLVYFEKNTEKDSQAGKAASTSQMTQQMLRWLIAEVQRLLAAGITLEGRPLRTDDIAVLVNYNNTARKVYLALQEVGIASVLASTASVWQSEAAEELFRVLLAISRLEDERLLRGALITSLCGMDARELHALRTDETRWEDLRYDFRGYQEAWLRDGFGVMIQRFLHGQGVRERLLARLDGERLLVDLQHIADLVTERAQAQELGMEGVLSFYRTQMRNAAGRSGTPEAEQLRREKDEAAVQIVTVHKSKGLEYPVTFVMEGWAAGHVRDYIYHDAQRGGLVWLHQGPAESEPEPDDPDELFADEEADLPPPPPPAFAREASWRTAASSNLRQFYVALTRAQHRCYLFHAHSASGDRTRGKPALINQTPPLGYLLNNGPLLAEEESNWYERTDEALLEDLREFTLARPELVALTQVPFLPPGENAPVAMARPLERSLQAPLRVRPFTAAINRDWRILSFTYLKHSRSEEAELALSASALPDAEEGAESAFDEPTPEFEEPMEEIQAVAVAGPGGPWSIHALPAGARTGTMLHQILERLDFTDLSGLEADTERALKSYGISPRFAPAVARSVREALEAPHSMPRTPDTVPPLQLSAAAPAQCQAEMQFWLPIGEFLPRRLAEVLRRHHAESPLLGALASDVQHMGIHRLNGFLTGFIDLVCEQHGLYYIIDWKTNRLGDSEASYTPEALAAAMRADLYTLQYLLYTVAMHRHLSARLPGYHYERHFGGVIYLFLRGAASRPGHGAYRDRPSSALIEDLSRLFG